jgi:hypothetical protein
MGSTGFHRYAKILASVALVSSDLYFAINQPGPMDAINGAISGMVMYAIWFAEERKK